VKIRASVAPHFFLSSPKNTTMGISDILAQQKAEKSAANLQAGQAFLSTNALRETVVSLPSGLQYEILTQGTGEKPLASHQVK
jgi:FKBP-type peptidyl-prolyl cis-trans isomerase FklB